MTVWNLARLLFWHALRGRGSDLVYLYLHDDEKDWLLTDMTWTDGPDRFVVLVGEPQPQPQPEPT